MPITVGTNQPAITSASRAIGGLEPCASSTSFTICASAVSAPTRVALNVNEPVLLTVPPMTSSPASLSTGIGSPVSIDSSTAEAPVVSTPSTGTRSPGRTRTRSPTSTSPTGRSVSMPSRITRAVRGCRPIRRRMASPVWPLARASSMRPSRMRVMISAAESKYIGSPSPCAVKKPGKRTPSAL